MKKVIFTLVFIISILSVFVSCASLNPFVNDYEISSKADFTVTDTWTVNHFTDSYGEPTDKRFVGGYSIEGHFSNSATSDSRCTGYFRVGEDGQITILIWEYNEYKVSAIAQDEWYNVSLIKDGVFIDKTRSHLTGSSFNIGIYSTSNGSADTFMDVFCEGGLVQIRLSGGKYTTSTYLLTFDTTGFASALSEMFPIKVEENN